MPHMNDDWFGVDASRLSASRSKAQSALLGLREPGGHWVGELSASALSTATAITTIRLAVGAGLIDQPKGDAICHEGLEWLVRHVNPDGGWGDTDLSHSNISTTTLCWAAFGIMEKELPAYKPVVLRAERWISERTGGLTPECIAPAIIRRYGKDRTFSVPILTMCALAGRLGRGRKAWHHVIQLPFELAAFPHKWFAALRLPVVSYALPALIAIGLVRHIQSPSMFPWMRMMREKVRPKVIEKLESIQPDNGGFLEATPLTSFVTMSLIGAGYHDHVVTRRGLDFLLASQQNDGSWAIDTNLSTWVTSLSVQSLLHRPGDSPLSWPDGVDPGWTQSLNRWYISQQYKEIHPYTQAEPGGWAWTPLPGGVPDADDTPGALIALHRLGHFDPVTIESVSLACQWLLDLQNSDGGIPTFCRGWGKLPFDKSSPDLTAHTIRAWLVWRKHLQPELADAVRTAIGKALGFLSVSREDDGTWRPLWFGNQWADTEANTVYGTARVACAIADGLIDRDFALMTDKALGSPHPAQSLVAMQNADGSWGMSAPHKGSIEETAQAVEALSLLKLASNTSSIRFIWKPAWQDALAAGANYLIDAIQDGSYTDCEPIGFYFASLWYYEKLYPMAFTVAALQDYSHCMRGNQDPPPVV